MEVTPEPAARSPMQPQAHAFPKMTSRASPAREHMFSRLVACLLAWLGVELKGVCLSERTLKRKEDDRCTFLLRRHAFP
jgi:hypothetical protein